ncbi:hypothetical protein [Saccharopolyspora pogona]|uniref:hypothetical protein n=1 Tax=Saccharopolyspora pogona TaxID=333966 RepID=UPI001CC26490|nr:hypothetical protein [Saccharopolyspora pogona]
MLVSALGVLLGAITILPSAVGIVLSMIALVVALVIGTVTVVRDLRHLCKRRSTYEFSLIAAPVPAPGDPRSGRLPRRWVQLPTAGPRCSAMTSTGPSATGPSLCGWPTNRTGCHRPCTPSLRTCFPCAPGAGCCSTVRWWAALRSAARHRQRRNPLVPHRFFDFQCSNELCAMRITRRARTSTRADGS